jgi:CheY-like chemotaxis protein
MKPKEFIILIAEDSEDDVVLLRRALEKAEIKNPVQVVPTGEQVIAYMEGKGTYGNRNIYPLPALLILDIKMPKLNGLEVLHWISEHPQFKVVPTIIFTSSNRDHDICKSFELGAHGYFVKPSSLAETENIFRTIRDYWNVSYKPEPALCHKILSAEEGVPPAPT